jgi:hypothetical protein
MRAKWEEYNEVFSKLEPTKISIKGSIDEKRAVLKRSVAQMHADNDADIMEADKKMSMCKKKASKLPNGFAKLMENFAE